MKKNVEILLFNPAPRSGMQAQRRVELPLGLLCIASPLDRQGYSVRIIDEYANLQWKREFSVALERKPLCFGVTSMTGPQIRRALAGCLLVRQKYPDVPIIWGGIHASLLPEQTLAHPLVDIVVIGEGEETFQELVKALESGSPLADVKGIAYQDNGKIHFTPPRPFVNLDEQPPLSYHLVNMARYRRFLFGLEHVSVNSSRGCVYGCGFCWDPVIHKRKWRAMSPSIVIEHLKRLIADYHFKGFLFTDDNFFIDMNRAYDILLEIVSANLAISISKLQIRADQLGRMDKDFLQLLCRAGVKRLTIGVESGSQRLMDYIEKKITIEQAIEANRKIAPYPITPLYLFMMGLPTERPEELAQSFQLAMKLSDDNPRALKTFNIYTPFPGTKLYDACLELGLTSPHTLEQWPQFNFRNIPDKALWISPQMKRLILGLDFPMMFLGKGFLDKSYKKTHPIVVALAKLYYPLALYRVKHLEARLPIESVLAKAIGVFARQ